MMPAVPAQVDLATSDRGVSGARLKAGALGVVGALLVPLPATAAPAPCEQARRYAALSGAELMRIGSLDLRPAGRDDTPVKDVGVGDAKSALVAQSAINAAALGRVLDGGPAGRKALAEVFQQTAPPTHQQPKRRKHDATEVGPFSLGASTLTVHARWEPGMACGNAEGEATRAEAGLRRAGVLDDGDTALLRVPGKISSLSTTALERRGAATRSVAAASLAGGRIELLDGAVTVKVVKPPSLLATMSGTDGGEVRYQPARLEVSGAGFETSRLDTAGDNVELRLDEDGQPISDTADEADPSHHKDPAESAEGFFAGLPESGTLGSTPPLPLPSLPGAPPLDNLRTEAAPAAGPGTTVRIALGDVRQAVSGHAIAAKATAMTIAITKGPDRQAYGDSAPNRGGTILDLDVGLLEVAAVAPEPAGGVTEPAGGASSAVGGAGAGLPITGPRVDALALAGVGLLIAGVAALIFGTRRRHRR